mmetsp:Transcript_8325/g.18179  ORF Transcript_8325/g.18179 Transcript_8325/m.18179 type:complete len:121 (+) Transcript_8325:313-675(+)
MALCRLFVVLGLVTLAYGENSITTNEFTYQGAVEDMIWVGESNTILFLTSKSQVYRSIDTGKTFEFLGGDLSSSVSGGSTNELDSQINDMVTTKNAKKRCGTCFQRHISLCVKGWRAVFY